MLATTIAGSLPKPDYLAEPLKLWPQWRASGAALTEAKHRATLEALRLQETSGIDVVTDGEQSRQHFVHGFLERIEGVDFNRRQVIGIRANRYQAACPTVVGAIRRAGPVHGPEARYARAHTQHALKFTMPGPMTIVDTLADEHYRSREKLAFAFAEALNEEARELQAAGVDVIQFDEPAFNVYADEVRDWGVAALERAARDLNCVTAVHICYGYGIQANIDWKNGLGAEWRQYESVFPLLDKSSIGQVSLECANSRVPLSLLSLLPNKDVQAGAIDVASNTIETPEEVAALAREVMRYVPPARLYLSTNCGMAPMAPAVAAGKLRALAQGAALARKSLSVK